jgi:putative transposase
MIWNQNGATAPKSARTVTDITPDRVTTNGHDSYPRAIRATLGGSVQHGISRYLNNRLEQDHRGIKGRYQPMCGFKRPRLLAVALRPSHRNAR